MPRNLADYEEDFYAWTVEQARLLRSGEFMGVFRHVGADDQNALRIELISEEAVKTSEIEGEILNRDSVQS